MFMDARNEKQNVLTVNGTRNKQPVTPERCNQTRKGVARVHNSQTKRAY